MDELTQRLTADQPVSVGGPQPTREELQRRLGEIGYAFIKFTETRGGTDLGIRVDRAACDLSAANFEDGTGTVHIEGMVILNDDPVRCVANVDLATLRGTGHLVPVEMSEVEALAAAG
jgi:hypothetical protein